MKRRTLFGGLVAMLAAPFTVATAKSVPPPTIIDEEPSEHYRLVGPVVNERGQYELYEAIVSPWRPQWELDEMNEAKGVIRQRVGLESYVYTPRDWAIRNTPHLTAVRRDRHSPDTDELRTIGHLNEQATWNVYFTHTDTRHTFSHNEIEQARQSADKLDAVSWVDEITRDHDYVKKNILAYCPSWHLES